MRAVRAVPAALVAAVTLVSVASAGAAHSQSASPARAATASIQALRGSVSIAVNGTRVRGRFNMEGAIEDRGTYVDRALGGGMEMRVVRGAQGTIWIRIDPGGHWRITRGTKAYAGLRGRGTESGSYLSRTTHVVMVGTVWK